MSVLLSIPCSFCRLFSKPLRLNTLFRESSRLVYYLLLVISFLKFIFSRKYWKYVVLPFVSYGTSTSFRLQKETSYFSSRGLWNSSDLCSCVLFLSFWGKWKLEDWVFHLRNFYVDFTLRKTKGNNFGY